MISLSFASLTNNYIYKNKLPISTFTLYLPFSFVVQYVTIIDKLETRNIITDIHCVFVLLHNRKKQHFEHKFI